MNNLPPPQSPQAFRDELMRLEERLVRMGQMVDAAVQKAAHALRNKDIAAAEAVVEGDERINAQEIALEQRCLELLAQQQPSAADVRFLGVVLKTVTDLERMGDHARDIAQVTLRLDGQELIKPLIDIPRMGDVACRMIGDGLEALVNRDVEAARAMAAHDNEMDRLYGQVFKDLVTYMIEDQSMINQATNLLMVAASLERIGDHATNMAEWVIYLVTSERVELNK